MIRDFMWQHPELFTWLLCGGSTALAVCIVVGCYSFKGKDSDQC